MAISRKLKKGGEARYVIQGATNNDFFLLPRGFHLRYLAVENLANLPVSGTVSLGKVPATYTTATFAVTTAITTSAQTFTWGGGAFGTFVTTVASATGATFASSAAFIAAQSPVPTGPTLGASWIVTSNGASVTMISSAPGPYTAPTLGMGGTGCVISAVTTVQGTLDVTYMPASVLQQQVGSITEFTPFVLPAYKVNSSQVGTTLTTTFTSTTGAAGTYYVGSSGGLLNTQSAYVVPGVGPGLGNSLTNANVGTPVAIPNSFTAIATGFVMGGQSYYQFTITGGGGAGTNFINSTSFTSSAVAATAATNLAATFVPGWMILSAAAVVTMYATASGFTPAPVFTAGTATVITIGSITSVPGYNVPGYVLANATPVTNTITVSGVAGSAGKVSLIGIPITVPNTFTVAQSSILISGCATYFFTIASSSTGTNYINGALFTANATPSTTVTNLVNLVNVPGQPGDPGGWVISTGGGAVCCMQGQVPGIYKKPVFSAGAVAAPVLTPATDYFFAGVAFPTGYSSTFTASTAIIVGPAPLFQVLDAPTTQTYATVFTFAGSTGVSTITQNQNLNPGAPAPFLSGAITTQTYAQSTLAGDLPYYVNFSQEPNGLVNVYALLEKMS